MIALMRKYGMDYLVSLTSEQLNGFATNRLLGMYKKLRVKLSADFGYQGNLHYDLQPQMGMLFRRLIRILNTREHVPRLHLANRRKHQTQQNIREKLKNTHLKRSSVKALRRQIRELRKRH